MNMPSKAASLISKSCVISAGPLSMRAVIAARNRLAATIVLIFLASFVQGALPTPATDDPDAALRQAVGWIQGVKQLGTEYDYIMTARVRLLFFWAGRDDVGGGYIRRGVSSDDPSTEVFQLVMGSDPAKAPRGINRWGAATEVVHHHPEGSQGAGDGAFFGFMKISKGSSVSEMERELARDGQGGGFLFQAIINRSDAGGAVSKVVPFSNRQDFNLHQLDSAVPAVWERLLADEGITHRASGVPSQDCIKESGFLSSVSSLIDAGMHSAKLPQKACYAYNGALYRMTLAKVRSIPRRVVHLSLNNREQSYERTYEHLLLIQFQNLNQTSKEKIEFEMLVGTEGALRGVPVQITYQPNWWFQVVLNLSTLSTRDPAQPAGSASSGSLPQ
jgi:hypothetical protein